MSTNPNIHPVRNGNDDYGRGNNARSFRVLSFAVSLPSHTGPFPLKIEYPELESFLNDGYEIWDVVPSCGNSNYYFITFVLRKRSKKKTREVVGFTRSIAR